MYLLAATGPVRGRLSARYQRGGLDPANKTGVAGDADEVGAAWASWHGRVRARLYCSRRQMTPDMAGFAGFVARRVRPLVKSSAARGWVLSMSLNRINEERRTPYCVSL